MRVMTYNLWDGGAARAQSIAAVIAAAQADIVVLNEADDERVVASLATQLAYTYIWARGSGDKHIALLSRWPVAEWRIYNHRPITQAVLAVSIQPPPAESQRPLPSLQLYCVHLLPYFMLLPYELARWRTVRALLQLVRRDAHGPHLILGDFNAAMRGERADTTVFSRRVQRQLWWQANRQPRFALAQIVRAGYTDCFRQLHPQAAGRTWMPWALSARLDYIFADALLTHRLQQCDVITAPPADRASDHFPLLAEFSL